MFYHTVYAHISHISHWHFNLRRRSKAMKTLLRPSAHAAAPKLASWFRENAETTASHDMEIEKTVCHETHNFNTPR